MMIKVLLRNNNKNRTTIKIKELNDTYITLQAQKLEYGMLNSERSVISNDIKLELVDNITAASINNYQDYQSRFYVCTNARPENISDAEFEIFKDRNNALLYKLVTPHLFIIKDGNDILIYSTYTLEFDDSIEYEVIREYTAEENYGSVDDIIRELNDDILSHEAKINYFKFRRLYDHENKKFYGSLGTFATPTGSYMDLELDFLLNYVKFLYENKDTKLLEFLNNNSKYKKIFDMSLSNGNNTVSNKDEKSIDDAFSIKSFIQSEIKEHNERIEKIKQANSEEELKNIINEPINLVMFN